MIRYVCDTCGKTADNTLPAEWVPLQMTEPTPGPPGSVVMVALHVCQDHDVRELISGVSDGPTSEAKPAT